MTFSKNVNFSGHKLPSNPSISTRECPKILKICQITKLDMGFQKKNISSRSEDIDFFESCDFLRQCLLKYIEMWSGAKIRGNSGVRSEFLIKKIQIKRKKMTA